MRAIGTQNSRSDASIDTEAGLDGQPGNTTGGMTPITVYTQAVQSNRLAENVGAAAKALLPERMRQHQHLMLSRDLISACERAPKNRRHAERLEERRRDSAAAHRCHAIGAFQRESGGAKEGHRREGARLLTPLGKAPARDAKHLATTVTIRGLPDKDEPIGIRNGRGRQRTAVASP